MILTPGRVVATLEREDMVLSRRVCAEPFVGEMSLRWPGCLRGCAPMSYQVITNIMSTVANGWTGFVR